MSSLAQDLDAALCRLEPQAAQRIEYLVRETLALAEPILADPKVGLSLSNLAKHAEPMGFWPTRRSTRPSMAAEIFWDTSDFFALLNSDDPAHRVVRQAVTRATAEGQRDVTTEWIIGECCTLLVARRKPHLVPPLPGPH